ncbi:MAG: ArsS family sensor histidine kinase [Campylobacteraceae bacterium]
MKNYSLSTKVHISFGLCILLLFISLLTFSRYQNEREMEKFKERHFQAINYLATLYQNHTPPKDIEVYFKNFGLQIIENKDLAKYVLESGEIVFQRPSNLGMVSVFLFNDKYYIFLSNVAVQVLLESQAKVPNTNSAIMLTGVVFLLLAWVYISTLRSIHPLTTLRQVVRKFANGNMDVECKSDRDDEIGELSNEFDKAIKTIRDLLRSRQLFLRTIMHELKTPIGKGRIVTEMISDDLQKNRLRSIFERLELLINEFSKIEQLISKNYSLNKQNYELGTVFEQAFDILFLDPEQLEKKVSLNLGKKRLHVNADLDLLALAFKNLIDNAIKYSTDSHVKIVLEGKKLSFLNKGEPFTRKVEELKQAFVTTATKQNSGDTAMGLGLGLYIIESILKMHNLKLEYEYIDGQHCFYINLIEA